ncbi:hypothetical protein [Arthrobacter sp.]|uniref:hypothetical protein n=1 Tax=Arthrobacter sp. TaxID=1667 RepID=UPI00366E6C3A
MSTCPVELMLFNESNTAKRTCGHRPLSAPGKIALNVTCPFSSASWTRRTKLSSS